jgi:hypothetical protein
LETRAVSAAADRRNLKGMSRSTQYSWTTPSSRSALSTVADAWIFQPCKGSGRPPAGVTTNQSSCSRSDHPSGSERVAAAKETPAVCSECRAS